MLVADGNGLPIGFCLASLVRHERYLSTFRAFFLLARILISLRYV